MGKWLYSKDYTHWEYFSISEISIFPFLLKCIYDPRVYWPSVDVQHVSETDSRSLLIPISASGEWEVHVMFTTPCPSVKVIQHTRLLVVVFTHGLSVNSILLYIYFKSLIHLRSLGYTSCLSLSFLDVSTSQIPVTPEVKIQTQQKRFLLRLIKLFL